MYRSQRETAKDRPGMSTSERWSQSQHCATSRSNWYHDQTATTASSAGSRYRAYTPHIYPRELRIGARHRRAKRQRVLRVIVVAASILNKTNINIIRTKKIKTRTRQCFFFNFLNYHWKSGHRNLFNLVSVQLRACETLLSAREVALVALSAKRERHIKDVFHIVSIHKPDSHRNNE